MTTVGALIEQVRVMMTGSLIDNMNVLDADYTAGSGQIVMRYGKLIAPGGLVCVGATTFYVWDVSSDKKTLTVQAGTDGSPDVDIPSDTIVRLQPSVTNFQMFDEWNRQALALSSPFNGLFSYGSFGSAPDYTSGTYPFPDTAPWNNNTPVRLLVCRYRPFGVDYWVTETRATWQPDEHVVRLPGPQPSSDTIQFVFAFGFNRATDFSTDPTTLGFSENNWDIPGLGVAATMHRTWEGRRVQPLAQGDARRAEEVQAGANIGVARDWALMRQQRINEELARQIALYPFKMPVGGIL